MLMGSCVDPRSNSESSSSLSRPKSSTVDMKLVALQSFHQLGTSGDTSSFAKHGADPKRIRAVLRKPPCDCKCSLPSSVLIQTCRTFWSLPKTSQDAVLWSLQSETGRKTWKIEGLVLKRVGSRIYVLFIFNTGLGQHFWFSTPNPTHAGGLWPLNHRRLSSLSNSLATLLGHWQGEAQPNKEAVPGDWWPHHQPG